MGVLEQLCLRPLKAPSGTDNRESLVTTTYCVWGTMCEVKISGGPTGIAGLHSPRIASCVAYSLFWKRSLLLLQSLRWRWMCDSPRTGCARRTAPVHTWREQAIIEWIWHVMSIVACCHSAKLCAHAVRDFRSLQNGAVTRMWRSCQVQPSHKERAIGVARCKKEGMLLQPLRWCCLDWVIHHEQDVREEQHPYICGANKQQKSDHGVWSLFLLAATVKLCAFAARAFRSQH